MATHISHSQMPFIRLNDGFRQVRCLCFKVTDLIALRYCVSDYSLCIIHKDLSSKERRRGFEKFNVGDVKQHHPSGYTILKEMKFHYVVITLSLIKAEYEIWINLLLLLWERTLCVCVCGCLSCCVSMWNLSFFHVTHWSLSWSIQSKW